MKVGKQVLMSAGIASLALLGVVAESNAVNINTSGTACKGYGLATTGDFYTFSDGIRNATTAARYVICPVARSPLSGTSGGFYVSGANYPGTTTSCTLYSWEYNGTFKAAKSFSSSAARYDAYLSFTNVELPYGAFVSLMCSLPPHTGSVLRGVAAYQ